MISQLSDGLKEIIEFEKRAGNKVVQVDRNWPQCGNTRKWGQVLRFAFVENQFKSMR